jgi:hypothetical protein
VEENPRVEAIVIAQKPVGADHYNGFDQLACCAISGIIDLPQGLRGARCYKRGSRRNCSSRSSPAPRMRTGRATLVAAVSNGVDPVAVSAQYRLEAPILLGARLEIFLLGGWQPFGLDVQVLVAVSVDITVDVIFHLLHSILGYEYIGFAFLNHLRIR